MWYTAQGHTCVAIVLVNYMFSEDDIIQNDMGGRVGTQGVFVYLLYWFPLLYFSEGKAFSHLFNVQFVLKIM